jgi:two-component system, NarL family, response regulator NreC
VSTRKDIQFITRKKIRCALLHEHILLRQGLRRLLEDEPDIEIVSETGNAMDCLDQVRESRPQLLIAGRNAFRLSASEVQLLIERESSETKLIFLDAPKPIEGARQEVDHSATRDTSIEDLVRMVRKVCATDHWSSVQPHNMQVSAPQQEVRVLTAREQEVLKLLAEGKTVRAAATDLGLSSKTVDAHKFNLMRKLGLHNKADLVMWAIQKKVVKIPAEI